MKVFFIIHLPPPVHGPGIMGSYIKESITLNKAFDCRYVNLSTSGKIDEIGKNPLGKVSRYFSLLWQVIRQLVIFRPDICYLTPYTIGKGFYKDAFIVFLLKLSRKKIVFHLHNKGVAGVHEGFFNNLLYRKTFGNTHVILLSGYLYEDVARYIKRDQVYYCANGIPEIEHSVSRGTRKEPELLFLSNLIRSKGIVYLIDACSILHSRNIPFHCTISGSNGDLTKEELAEVIRSKGLESFIMLLPPAYGKDKHQLMSSAGIFVHPSFNDCMPLVLIEAMQFSLPVVSTYEGAIPDVVDDGRTGMLVRQKDAIALADAIEKLICNPELRLELGENGYWKYKDKFALEKFESRLIEILSDIGKIEKNVR